MTIFLVAVAKHSLLARGADAARVALTEHLSRVADTYAGNLGAAYTAQPSIEHLTADGSSAVLSWNGAGTRSRVHRTGGTWSVHAGTDLGDRLNRAMLRRAGSMRYEYPVWGQYAAVLGDRYADGVFAWNTSPALEAIHFGESERFVLISNRPRLAAVGRSDNGDLRYALSDAFVPEYLLYGYSVTGQTPFEGVHTLSARSALTVRNGHVKPAPFPYGLEASLATEHTEAEGADALTHALREAAGRIFAELPATTIQVRMSGGKDSRVLLGLLRGGERPIEAVTFGQPNDPEVAVSRALVKLAQVPHRVGAPPPARGTSIAERVLSTLADSDGLPPSEPHTSIYAGAAPNVPGEGVALGQWPLMKGGLAKRMRYTHEQALNTVLAQGADIVHRPSRAAFDSYLRDWFRNVEADNALERLYLYARDFRSGRWLHSHIALYSRDATITYPISDAEVTAVSDALNMGEKISQRIYRKSMEQIWPDAASLPLVGSSWGPHPDAGSETLDDFLARIPRIEQADGPPATEYSVTVACDMARELQTMGTYPSVRQHLSSEMEEAVRSAADGQFRVPDAMSKRSFIKNLWRVFVVTLWLTRAWEGQE